MTYEGKLQEISEQLKQGTRPESVTARTFISWFGAERRSHWNVKSIRDALNKYRLATSPDFESVYIDDPISFLSAPKNKADGPQEEIPPDVYGEPTYRIGKLASANTKPVSVKPDDPIARAVTLMITHDFSQLPVMTSGRTVNGIISWQSLGSQLALGREVNCVRDCMVDHKEISSETDIFAAVDDIVANQYVLIRGPDNLIRGIVTTSDLSLQFRQLGEPFLLVGEIENYIRLIIQGAFTKTQLAAACGPSGASRDIQSPADLTIGEYLRLFENPENWKGLALPVDREIFVQKLEDIRRIRNDVMHFNPDGIVDEDVEKLRDFVRLMHNLARAGAIRRC